MSDPHVILIAQDLGHDRSGSTRGGGRLARPPLSVIGMALLLLNDHVLKRAWPGLVTGKLSDLAGMLVFPPLLAALMALTHPKARAKTLAVVALCLTGCGFAVIKSFGTRLNSPPRP